MKPYDIPWPNRRKMRADALAAMTMRAVERYLDNSPEALDHNVRKRAHQELFDMFYQVGADIVTDLDRANAGLPARNSEGYTDEELQILEASKREMMIRPMLGTVLLPT